MNIFIISLSPIFNLLMNVKTPFIKAVDSTTDELVFCIPNKNFLFSIDKCSHFKKNIYSVNIMRNNSSQNGKHEK